MDSNASLYRFQIVWVERDCRQSGKRKGDGVTVLSHRSVMATPEALGCPSPLPFVKPLNNQSDLIPVSTEVGALTQSPPVYGLIG